MVITSVKNEKIKKIASLKDKKGRKEQKAYLVEGIKMVKEAFLYSQKVVCVIGRKDLLEEIPSFDGEVIEADEKVLNFLSDCETCQGVFAVVKMPVYSDKTPKGVCVLLDRVRDPGNLGTIIRTSVACGVENIYLLDCADSYSPKVIRSSMSGIYNVNLYEISQEELDIFDDIPLVCADMDGENVFESEIKGDFCLCMGNEANGVSEQVMAKSKKTVKIPMRNKIESLNVAVAYAIIIYNLVKF